MISDALLITYKSRSKSLDDAYVAFVKFTSVKEAMPSRCILYKSSFLISGHSFDDRAYLINHDI